MEAFKVYLAFIPRTNLLVLMEQFCLDLAVASQRSFAVFHVFLPQQSDCELALKTWPVVLG